MKNKLILLVLLTFVASYRVYADSKASVTIAPEVRTACHAVADFLRKIPNVKMKKTDGEDTPSCQVVVTGLKDLPMLENHLRAQGWRPDQDFSRMFDFGPSGSFSVIVKDKTDCFIHWETPIESEDPDEKVKASVETSTYTVNCTSKSKPSTE